MSVAVRCDGSTTVLATTMLATLAALAACSKAEAPSSLCHADDQCGAKAACVAGSCVPLAAASSWDVEIAPRTDSTAGFTEAHLDAAASHGAVDLTTSPKTMLTGTLSFDAAATPLKTAHVVLTVPATIAGRPDLQLETDLDAAAPRFALAIPSALLGRAGTLRVLPSAPDNATHAPSTFAVTLAAALSLSVSSKPVTVSGHLLTALGDPVTGLLAHAFQDGNLVSNVVTTDAQGAFTLVVPVGGADAPSPTALAVELEPTTSDAPAPHFWATPFPLTTNTDLGDVRLPAYSQPITFKFTFQASGGAAVPGALVRARTVLSSDAAGTTDFLRDGLTDAAGQVSLNLFPGSTAASRLYDIAVVPPADAPFAATCVAAFPLVTGGLPSVVMLDVRPVVSGQISGDDGTRVGGATVVATRTAPAQASTCDDYASTPQVTTTSKADGTFTLHLDPGTYTFDVDPPSGAPYPRLTETGVSIAPAATSPTTTHDVRLLPARVLRGTIHDGAGAPMPLAGVRFYAPGACAAAPCPAPVLAAQAHADANGNFRAIVPAAPP